MVYSINASLYYSNISTLFDHPIFQLILYLLWLKKVNFIDAIRAHREESKIHKNYKDNKLSKNKMSSYMKYGNTECYPIEMKEILLEKLANLGNK